MADPREISINDYTYDLPDEKIALFPLPQRDASKLLIFKDEQISEDIYANIASHLPQNSLLVFNNTKVINARLRFQKPSGGVIEIFCLEPHDSINEYSTVMNKRGSSTWKCFIGGASKWKSGLITKQFNDHELSARIIDKLSESYIVEFSWTPEQLSFAEVLEAAGDVPLPPYIKRSTESSDHSRYQTIYAQHEGSVAAPTAGLHFTEKIFKDLEEKGIARENITLHVGAGTFKPVKASVMNEHEMHAEWIDVSKRSIEKILLNSGNIIAVGTTSARTIESLYWLGVKSILHADQPNLRLNQWDVYEDPLCNINLSVMDALNGLIKWMEKKGIERIFTQTQLLIMPGYSFKILKGIITNFHQPKSTLLLLVAAATHGRWKRIYEYALKNDFRFLSYGDGNLIFI